MKILEPCPFCASENLSVNGVAHPQVRCKACGCAGPYPSTTGDEREAVTLWNQRLDSEREPDE